MLLTLAMWLPLHSLRLQQGNSGLPAHHRRHFHLYERPDTWRILASPSIQSSTLLLQWLLLSYQDLQVLMTWATISRAPRERGSKDRLRSIWGSDEWYVFLIDSPRQERAVPENPHCKDYIFFPPEFSFKICFIFCKVCFLLAWKSQFYYPSKSGFNHNVVLLRSCEISLHISMVIIYWRDLYVV